jgi:4-alpha-glucanotransferase
MTEDLDRLAEAHGIELSYISETGEYRVIGDETKRALLDCLGAHDGVVPIDGSRAPVQRCYLPDWLQRGRSWGVTVQLYGVPSHRNHGIGDFEDVARLAEMIGPLGADFIGINPIHALFFADPSRCSPYFPSSRQFLNPLYIALDRLPGAGAPLASLAAEDVTALRADTHVDYARVAALKRRVLEEAFSSSSDDAEFVAYREREGASLERFAIFEALSEMFVAQGFASGWHGWPEAYRLPDAAEVQAFREVNSSRILFHQWLQWIAVGQLVDVQKRALAAGLRIGLYLDLAVGVAPDGAATWCDPDAYAAGARIGAPPDLFNNAGQDWGLAPFKPASLAVADGGPFGRDLAAAMRSAGAVRIDHAMGLKRLFWIPAGFDATGGGYIRYPFAAMIDGLAALSQEARAVVIGEDLGTVPPGFRETMREAGLLGYRVFYFEHDYEGRFKSPADYTDLSLACLSTHDLAPICGWWAGRDLDIRETVGKFVDGQAGAARTHRERGRSRLVEALAAERLVATVEVGSPQELADDHFVALHVFLARTPCRLLAIQLEDLAGAVEQVNLPGTRDEYRNWALKLPIGLEDLMDRPLLQRTLEAVAAERPRAGFS